MHMHTTTGMAVTLLSAGLSHDTFYGAQLQGEVANHAFEGITVNPDERSRMLASIGDKHAVFAPSLPRHTDRIGCGSIPIPSLSTAP